MNSLGKLFSGFLKRQKLFNLMTIQQGKRLIFGQRTKLMNRRELQIGGEIFLGRTQKTESLITATSPKFLFSFIRYFNKSSKEEEESLSLTQTSTKKIKRSDASIMKPKIAKNIVVVKLFPDKIIDDEQSFLKVTNVNGTIPVYVDTSGILEQLNSKINSTENKIIVIADNPGLGKTMTPFALAKQYGYACVRINAEVQLSTTDICKMLSNTLITNAKELNYEMEEILENWLISLLEHISPLLEEKQYLRNGDIKEIDFNTYDKASKNAILSKFEKTLKAKWNNTLLLQFDEASRWSTEKYTFDPNEKIKNLGASVKKFMFRALSLKLSELQTQHQNIKIFLTGTDLKIGEVIRVHSSTKTEIMSLPYWTPESILELLKATCRFDKIGISDDDIILKEVTSKIVGPVRNVEYFLDALLDLKKSPNHITIEDLKNCVKSASIKWTSSMPPLFDKAVDRYPNVMEELLIAWTLGTSDEEHPEDAVVFSSIPDSWYPLNDAGVVRLQELEMSGKGKKIYRMWKPYPFLLNYWTGKFNIFYFDDVFGLQAELFAGQTNPDKRKGFCFQRAVALELLNPQSSEFWKKLISLCKDTGLNVTPIPYQDKKIYFYSKDSEIKDDHVCMVQESRTKKIGDIAGIRLKDSKDQVWKLFIELKHSEYPKYVKEGLDKFKADYENWNPDSKENAIFVFLSYNNVGLKETNKSTEKKRFFVIDGIKAEDFSVDITSLSFPSDFINISDVISKLPFSQILTKIEGMKIWVKYGNEKAIIDLGGCQYVADLKEKIHENFGIPKDRPIVLKLKDEELKGDTKLSSLNLSEAIDPQNDSSLIIVQLFSGMKIWVKYENQESKIDLEGCEDVSDLREKIHEKFKNKMKNVDSSDLILKWKNEELKARTKLSSLNLSEAIDPQDDTSFLIVQLPEK